MEGVERMRLKAVGEKLAGGSTKLATDPGWSRERGMIWRRDAGSRTRQACAGHWAKEGGRPAHRSRPGGGGAKGGQ